MSRIVELHDKAPLILRKDQMEKPAVAICRCGLSAAWPFCDGSHTKIAEEPGRLAGYRRNDVGELERVAPSTELGANDPRSGIPR